MFNSTSMPVMTSLHSGLHRSRALQVRSSHGTPRLSSSSGPPQLEQKSSEPLIDFTARSAAMHRLSADERDIRYLAMQRIIADTWR
ncbi:hypothetical protein Tcan_16974 [Toxocara canis]|uniref:Uncharacterized protein n=1 Tax=Toxocara canis TaxID=6265 RepID=A0A0B2VFK1_TOXCA|nr:hypothetical protein Tcan_16974 [Toxocara canis]